MTNEEFESLKKDYYDGNILISIKLDKAREFLINKIYYKPAIVLYFLIYIFLIISCTFSFVALKWLGILYLIIFPLIWFGFMGSSSISKEKTHNQNILYYGIALSIFLGVIFNIKIAILMLMSTITLYLSYYLYQFCARVVIDKFIFKDVEMFKYLYNYVFFIKEQVNG